MAAVEFLMQQPNEPIWWFAFTGTKPEWDEVLAWAHEAGVEFETPAFSRTPTVRAVIGVPGDKEAVAFRLRWA